MAEKSIRIASIDVFRALTMLLMIWVNDFWTLENVPKWLEHASASEDYLGFSDLIFPWFLFIVGLSIPFAIDNRLRKGDSYVSILYHIVLRSVALLVMGVFHVNFPSYNAEAAGLPKPYFVILATAAFFLIWNIYPPARGKKKYLFTALQVTGIILLGLMAYIYRGGGDGGSLMEPKWWGILGLIGWAYLISAPVYLFFRKQVYIIAVFFAGFLALNIITDLDINYNIFSWQSGKWLPGNGSLHALVIAGTLISVLLKSYNETRHRKKLYLFIFLSSLGSFVAGLILHNHIIISKIQGTSTWIMFSLATGTLLFMILHWIVDHKHKKDWFNIIKPAGTATLTCYLIPYFYYSFRSLLNINFDGFITNGVAGLIKSMAFAFIIVGITWLLGKIKIKLKI